MALYLSDADVYSVIRMADVFRVTEQAFRENAEGKAPNLPRQHLDVPNGVYRAMSGAVPSLGGMATKMGMHSFKVPPGQQKAPTVTVLYGSDSGQLSAVIWSDLITDYRTGAMGGVAAKYLAREDARTVAMFGSGKQARTMLEAIALARSIERVRVYSPTPDHRVAYAEEMGERLGLDVQPVDDPRTAVEGADIVAGAANTARPIFEGAWVAEGALVISIGASRKADLHFGDERREVDDVIVQRSSVLTVDSMEQAIEQESPEMAEPLRHGKVVELGAVIAGRASGRTSDRQIALFKSFGMGLQDAATAALVYEKARAKGLGQELAGPAR